MSSWFHSAVDFLGCRRRRVPAALQAVDDKAAASVSQPLSDEGDDTIIIAGAGVIGLCTAYNLAKESRNAAVDPRQSIIVLEAQSSPFTAASSHNTGCLHYDFHDPFGKDIAALGKYSFKLWQAIARTDAQFVTDTGYRSQSFFPITPGTGKGLEALPNWVAAESDWDVEWGSKGTVCATINPQGIGAWLEHECIRMGAEIRTSTTIIDTIHSESGKIKEVKCTSAETGTDIIPCRTLILTTGPWTPSQLKALFPSSTLDLQPVTNAGDWLILQNSNFLDSKSVAAVFFNGIVHEKLEYAGRNDGTIWVCGRRNYVAELPPANQEGEPDDDIISDMMNYSQRFIRAGGSNEKGLKLSVVSKGRAFRPFTASGLPIISEIPSKHLFPSVETHHGASRVFICYGHGSYGVTLGMGSGRLMAQLVRGEKPDIDMSKFTVT
ncbi:FAD dependent oxidoreductase [Xylogone sp. PMI_703]|nr:FAD dependent oxidoreductase [Xylogone sp. PMI_703]